jgi:NAD+ kinase
VKPPSSALLLVDARDARTREPERRIARWLAQRGVEVLRAKVRKRVPEIDRAELVIVVGGDGTFLRAARAIGERQVPLVGVRFGTFGYLAELERDAWEKGLARLLDDGGTIETWMRLRCRVRGPKGPFREVGLALNEVVVTAEKVARMVDVGLRIDGEDVTRYRGDGMIVATPCGSTAHSLAAGGPIVDRTDRCLLVTPLASQAMTFRPLVLRSNRRVELVVQESRHGTALTVDGQETIGLTDGSVVAVEAAAHDVHVASVVERTRFRTIRERLHWGAPLVSDR